MWLMNTLETNRADSHPIQVGTGHTPDIFTLLTQDYEGNKDWQANRTQLIRLQRRGVAPVQQFSCGCTGATPSRAV